MANSYVSLPEGNNLQQLESPQFFFFNSSKPSKTSWTLADSIWVSNTESLAWLNGLVWKLGNRYNPQFQWLSSFPGQNHHKLRVSPISGTPTLPALSVETRCVSFRRRCSSRVRAQRSHGYRHRGSRALSWCCQWSYLNPGWRKKNGKRGVGEFLPAKMGCQSFWTVMTSWPLKIV